MSDAQVQARLYVDEHLVDFLQNVHRQLLGDLDDRQEAELLEEKYRLLANIMIATGQWA